MILGSLCMLYFTGIVLYAGLSTLFPCIWAVGGILFYGIALVLHLHEKYGIFSHITIPPVIRNGILVAAGGVLVFFLLVEGLIVSGMFRKPSDNLEYIVVLGAQVNGNKLSHSLRLRLERAEEYLKDNENTAAVLSGGKGRGENISEAEAMHRYLTDKGIQEERLLKEDRSVDTSQNLRYSLDIIDEREDGRGREASIGVVTNGFHVYRGVSIGKKQGCTAIEGVPAKSNVFLQLNYMVREFFGVVKDKVYGNL